MDSKKKRQKAQFISTFNNPKKISKNNSEKYNNPGSLNNTASSSFQNQQKNNSSSNSQTQLNNNNNLNINFIPMKKTKEKYNSFYNPILIEVNGDKPLPRFGHSLVKINQTKIVIFGGAVGEIRKIKYSNETYIYNIMTKIWIKLNNINNNKLPSARAAHAAAANDQMQMVIYGGSNNLGLIDDKLWILHLSEENEGIWDEINVVGNTPGSRYGHSLTYLNPYFVLFGGNSNPDLSNDVWIINIKNNICQWEKIIFDENCLIPCERLYHSSEICPKGKCEGMMIIFGGRNSEEKPLNDIWKLNMYNNNIWSWEKLDIKNEYIMNPRYNHSMTFYDELMIIIGGKGINLNNSNGNNFLPIEVFNMVNNEAYNFNGINMNRQTNFIYEKNIFLFGGFDSNNQLKPLGDIYQIKIDKLFEKNDTLKNLFFDKNNIFNININNNKKTTVNPNKKMQFKLTQDIIIGSGGIEDQNMEEPSTYHKVSINKLAEENKRIGEAKQNKNINLLLVNKHKYNEALIEKFIQTLLRPFDWFDEKVQQIHSNLPFTDTEILNLISEVKPILEKDQSLIRIRSPCKIFGNIYGIYDDLMRFFESYGNPSDDNQMGDINVMQYIFLGDFCDRGYHSLEVIFLLFALKIKYPQFIYLIRGHHEDKNINIKYGLGEECMERLSDDIREEKSIFANINKVFDLLPFGVLVDNNILMIHGGIGSSINTLDDIENIKRPISVEQNVVNKEQLKIIDLLWSEYSDDIDNIDINIERDKYKKGFIVKYGKERLNKFLDDNKINLLITSHQFVQGGFCTFNNDKILIVFSATNYMNQYENVGGMITIPKKNAYKRMNILPKLITFNKSKEDSFRRNNSPSPIRINNN